MAHALRLGARGMGQVWPNPAVGCIIEKEGRILGRGATQAGGRPHAEVVALAQAGSAARGATVHVTLEPCAHFGHTPPCAQGLIDAGIAHVSYAIDDPDPRVSGRGADMLRAAGIKVTSGIMEGVARADHAGFLKRVTQGLPFVTLKIASSLDGRIAMASGESQWITAPTTRAHVHGLRGMHDAVMVGSNTALADDPQLTVRGMGAVHQPVRVVVDGGLRFSPDSQLGRSTDIAPVWLLHGPHAPMPARQAWADVGAKLIETPMQNNYLDLRAGLAALAAHGITRVLCEGGGGLAAALLRAGLVDQIAIYTAGLTIGGAGLPSIADLGLPKLADAPRPRLIESRQIGPDLFSLWRF
jgi:diaminohydroxyphosphoribosylaminopyrimidine deaminase/5-amino-6-(5-phosphoribosylamino)uracil reductase